MLLNTALTLAALAGRCFSLPTIEAKGAKFFTSDGKQFFLKGIAYQLTNDDPLASTEQCQLDANLMKTLGANSIRVYHVDPTANHDGCMKAFSDAGIYAWIDLDTFSTYIIPKDLYWTQKQYSAYTAVMDTFQKYDNTAGFFVGNEVMNSGADSIAAPFVKAAARDVKAYRDSKGYRKIPVGYSAADIPALRPNLQNYMACGKSSEALDFFGLNAYEWCGNSDYKTSGYIALQQNASQYNIPIYFSETGCMTPRPRTFGDQSAIFGPEMSGTWSGAIIYEWIEEQNDFGIISYGPSATAAGPGVVDGYTRTGTPTPISPDFPNLSNQWKTLSPTGVSAAAYTPSLSPPACPAFTSGNWLVNGDAPLPTLGSALDAAVASSITGTAGRTTQASTGGASDSTNASTGSSDHTANASTGSASHTTSSSAAQANVYAKSVGGTLPVALVSFFGVFLGIAIIL